ncbi:MAG: N-acetyl-gamma-glutamyl-phosphate reductase [Candidatus Obscuribacterales bacterium]|nr:N-acetyl-gamma-glutamyl-phosphate reductase [Candidatus Obscuribacterales bacterium]
MDIQETEKIKVAVLGASGYTGQELVRLLLQHPHAEIKALTSRSYVGKPFSQVFPNFKRATELICSEASLAELANLVDLVFLALPHGEACTMITDDILDKTIVIDLGADFRLKDPAQYKQWYHNEHANPSLIQSASYGLCELNREQIMARRLIANPGCYATCSILSLAPLLMRKLIDPDSIIIDAKSGVSGAGRGLSLNTHFNETNENFKAYALASHRHTPEIEQELSRAAGREIKLSFTPHLVPMQRGILVTAYASLLPAVNAEDLQTAFNDYYGDLQFIRVYDHALESTLLPETRWVTGSNYCDIGFRVDSRTGRVIVVAALDNLIKGAAGQAIQNMNLLFNFPENAGLQCLPSFP